MLPTATRPPKLLPPLPVPCAARPAAAHQPAGGCGSVRHAPPPAHTQPAPRLPTNPPAARSAACAAGGVKRKRGDGERDAAENEARRVSIPPSAPPSACYRAHRRAPGTACHRPLQPTPLEPARPPCAPTRQRMPPSAPPSAPPRVPARYSLPSSPPARRAHPPAGACRRAHRRRTPPRRRLSTGVENFRKVGGCL